MSVARFQTPINLLFPFSARPHYIALMHKNEMRLDPLSGEWTLFSEARALQPASPSVLEEQAAVAADDPFVAGREQYTPHTLFQANHADGSWRVRVVR